MKKWILVLPLLFGIGLSHWMAAQTNPEIEAKVNTLLAKMTLEEKIGQMNQYNGFWNFTGPAPAGGEAANKFDNLKSGLVGSMLNVRGVENVRKVQELALQSRLGIPLIIGFDVIHGYKTLSPIPLAEAASWDMGAIERSSKVAATEAAASGINWTFAPMVDISRDARWGRVMEGSGEDPYLGAQIAAARVRGLQGKDLGDPLTIAACVKHFAAYGFAEAGRDYNTVDIGTSTLYNTVLPPFKAAADAGARTFMNSFNEINGIPATASALLQRDILKGEWGFTGFVVSDWGSIGELIPHGLAKDGKQAADLAVHAGSDMDMESYNYLNHLKDLVQSGQVDEGLIDDAVRRILRVKFELGLFDDPYRYCDEEREKTMIGNTDEVDAVLQMAKKSIVLLKNEKNLLPLPKSGKKIALIGPLAADKTSPLGSWRPASDDETAVSVLEGMERYSGNKLMHYPGVRLFEGNPSFVMELKINETDTSGFAAAIAGARQADVVVMVLGEHGLMTGEGRSRAYLHIPGLQEKLLKAVLEVNPNVILVLMNGRPLAIEWEAEQVPAIVEAWHLGTQSGTAIAQVLYGDYNPSGKLPMSFPRSVGQVPIYYNHKSTGRPNLAGGGMVFWSHYNDESNDPLYPFGFGIGYSPFEYSGLRITMGSGNSATVQVNVRNMGKLAGEEVVQVYLHDLVASVTRPVKELKAFEKIMLNAGESRTIRFQLDESAFGFYDNNGKWTVEPGDFDVMVGGNSADGLKGKITIQ